MKMSTKGIYAMEIMVDLAMHSGDGKLETLKNIANRRNLSEKYLERIVKCLKDAGIIVSVRGAHGGYCLAREASHITAREILLAAEGHLAPVACLVQEDDCGIECGACPTREIWRQIWEGILEASDQVSIQDIIDEIESGMNSKQ